jgi:ABC-type antimicrobial peptide transport system permease subunit
MMTLRTVWWRSLLFHARSHLGVILGATVGTAALVGALLVGDSVRGSLKARAEARLGTVHFALSSGDRYFRSDLAHRLHSVWTSNTAAHPPSLASTRIPSTKSPPVDVFQLRGTAVNQDGSARAHNVQIQSVPESFWKLAPQGDRFPSTNPAPGQVRLSTALAAQLNVAPGDTVVLRFAKPSAMSQDAVLSPRNEAVAALRLVVDAIASPDQFGEFRLRSSPRPAYNAWVHEADLARSTGMEHQANLLLIPELPDSITDPDTAASDPALASLTSALKQAWQLADAEIDVRMLTLPLPSSASTGISEIQQRMIEVGTRRIFLDAAVGEALLPNGLGADLPAPKPILTYLANALRSGDRLTPYSMVAAAGEPWTPENLARDEIVITDWLAKDLAAGVGDTLTLTYYDPEAGARLEERSQVFTVRAVVPLSGWHADRSLMPEFPGLSKAESTRDWDAGFPLVHSIRDEDEAYWQQWRGTPKAYVSLEAGQSMWGNRFGQLTAVRFLLPEAADATTWSNNIATRLRDALDPAEVGLAFQPVRADALRAAGSGQDFGGLFLGFSFFLIIAALLLMALLFQFGLEQRLPEVGTWLALGFRPSTVRRLWWAEGAALAAVGGLMGTLAGIGYARALIHGLTTLWSDAVAGATLAFFATPTSLAVGAVTSVILAVATLGWGLRRPFRRPVRSLLSGDIELPRTARRSRGWWVGGLAFTLAAGLVGWSLATGRSTNPGVFFGAGSLVLIGGLAWMAGGLARGSQTRAAHRTTHFTSAGLAVRGTSRRRSRSLATIALLACGTFLIAAIGAFRMDSDQDAGRRDSGTGGFALIGEASLPIPQDLNTLDGLEFYGLSAEDVPGISVVPFRVREGDEASCLNLDRAQRPRILGVQATRLAALGAFRFAQLEDRVDLTNGWQSLSGVRDNVIPAIGDAASIQWALGKKIGDTLTVNDERGRAFELRLVGGLANSIMQGNLIIDETAFNQLFPSESGYRHFLIDAPTDGASAVAATLTRALGDVGMEITPATRRLAEFQAVQNTYLSTFQVLGGLGLLLGSAGLGVVVLRNVLERRGELALLTAVGFTRRQIFRLVMGEHIVLLAAGLCLGTLAAAVAVLPSLLAPGGQLPGSSLYLTLASVLVVGLTATFLATRSSLRGSLTAGLRGE